MKLARPYTKPEHFGISAAPGGGFIGIVGPNEPDSELRWPLEGYGLHVIAWLPKRCRNGKIRWLCWVERHGPGDYTLSNRCG